MTDQQLADIEMRAREAAEGLDRGDCNDCNDSVYRDLPALIAEVRRQREVLRQRLAALTAPKMPPHRSYMDGMELGRYEGQRGLLDWLITEFTSPWAPPLDPDL